MGRLIAISIVLASSLGVSASDLKYLPYLVEVDSLATQWRNYESDRFEANLYLLKPAGMCAASLLGLAWQLSNGEDEQTSPLMNKACFGVMAGTLICSGQRIISAGFAWMEADKDMRNRIEKFELNEEMIKEIASFEWQGKQQFLQDIEAIRRAKIVTKSWLNVSDFLGVGN